MKSIADTLIHAARPRSWGGPAVRAAFGQVTSRPGRRRWSQACCWPAHDGIADSKRGGVLDGRPLPGSLVGTVMVGARHGLPPPAWNLLMPPGVLVACVDAGGLEAVIHHDHTARLAALYARHAPRAGRLAYLLTGDADLAEDLAQEAFTRLLARLGSIRADAAIAAYLRRSIVNLARKHWRKARNEQTFLRREGRNLATQTTMGPDLADHDELWRALQQLPHRQRAAIVLRFYEDLSEAETARVLGCAVGTVKSSVARGLRRLQKEMIGDEGVRA